jgi:HEAT repeat protein
MERSDLIDLIDRMNDNTSSNSSEQSISWLAHREAEKIDDITVLPLLREFVEVMKTNKYKSFRDNAYYIMGKALSKTMIDEYCVYLIERLSSEEDKYVLMHMLDLLAGLSIPEDIDISQIILCSESDKWQIRHSAIGAFGASSNARSRQALLKWVDQQDEKKYRYEIIYANVSLGKVGKTEDISTLEKHASSKIRDVRISAVFAIDSIKARDNS